MAAIAIRGEERIGLAVAVVAHAALAALLVLQPQAAPRIAPPERIEVTISDDVGLTSTSPEPASDAAPDLAPEIGEPPPPAPVPEPAPRAEPEPLPKPVPKAAPAPKPSPKASPAPRPTARATPAAKSSPAARPAAASPKGAAAPAERAGGSRIGADFLEGVRGAQGTQTARTPPAAAIGPAVRSALSGAISRQLKPKWVAPQGADAEKLVTILSWNLNRDGSLAGPPQVIRQEGITDANRAQAQRHAEQAVRAVQLAAPFDLPAEYYDAWKRVASFRFDKRLSQ